jgi:hypothetical protein
MTEWQLFILIYSSVFVAAAIVWALAGRWTPC